MKEQNNEMTKSNNQYPAKLVAESRFTFTGPLPPPEILAKYNEILPNAAERIISMAEGQAKHRQEQEKKIVSSETLNSKLGIIFAFIIAITAILAGAYLIYSGCEAGGLTTIISSLVVILGPFIYRQIQSHKQEKK